MPPKKSVGRSRRRNPIQLNDFLNGGEESKEQQQQQQEQPPPLPLQPPRQQQMQSQSDQPKKKNPSRRPSQTQTTSTISNGTNQAQILGDLDNIASCSYLSSVTPVMTPSSINQDFQSQAEPVNEIIAVTASAPAAAGADAGADAMMMASVWQSNSGHVEPRAVTNTYAPNMEEFPAIGGGAKLKKHRLMDGGGHRNDVVGGTSHAAAAASSSTKQASQRTRGRGRHVSAPVLGNFLPSAIPPASTVKHQEVGEWLKSVREISQMKDQQQQSAKKKQAEQHQDQEQHKKLNEMPRSSGGSGGGAGGGGGGGGSEPKLQATRNCPVISISSAATAQPPTNKQSGLGNMMRAASTAAAGSFQNKRRNRRSQRNWSSLQNETTKKGEQSSPTVLKLARPERHRQVGSKDAHSQRFTEGKFVLLCRPSPSATAAAPPVNEETPPGEVLDVSRSRLNSNAMEFRPSLNYREPTLQAAPPQLQPQVAPHDGGEVVAQPTLPSATKLGDRRSRQRFTRSLRPDTLFELVAPGLLPTPNESSMDFNTDSAPPSAQEEGGGPIFSDQSTVNYQSQPSQLVGSPGLLPTPDNYMDSVSSSSQQAAYLPDQGLIGQPMQSNANIVWSTPHLAMPMSHQNSNISQSVFRLASLPSTGVGTVRGRSLARATVTMPQLAEEPSDQWSNISPLPSTILCPSPSVTSNISQDQWGEALSIPTIHQDLQYTHQQLLDMDQTMTAARETDAQEEMQFTENGRIVQSEIIDVINSQDAGIIANRESINTNGDDDDDDTVAQLQLLPHFNILQLGQQQLFGPKSTKSSRPNLRLMPPSIESLYNLVCSKNSDYAFVYAISAQLCQKIVPMDSFVYLKMALLASLASIDKDEMRQPIALCIVSTDSTLANLLMSNVGQLAPRFIGPHDGGQQPSFNALPTRFNWITASPLLMAQRGVYFAGDWSCLSREQSDELQKCIENGVVPVPQLSAEQQLEAAIWTYWQPEHSKHSSNQTTAFANFCPIFGLPIYMGDVPQEDISNFVIQQHIEDESIEPIKDALHISDDDMRLLFVLLHEREVNFSDEAQYILKKYFIISRKERPSVFTSKTYIVLKQFAESFAKLSLRLDVLVQDIIVAIFHSEHFAQHICGASSCPPPAVTNFNGVHQVDAYMNEFARWLCQHLDRYKDDDDELNTQQHKQPPSKRRRLSRDI